MGLQTTIDAFFADTLADGAHASELQSCLTSCRSRLEEALVTGGLESKWSTPLSIVAAQLSLIKLMWRDLQADKNQESVATPYQKVDVWIATEALDEMIRDVVLALASDRKGEIVEAHLCATQRNIEQALFEAFRVACRAGKGDRYATAIPSLVQVSPRDERALDAVAAAL